MFDQSLTFATKLLAYMTAAFTVCIACLAAMPEWRKNLALPIAALLSGSVAGASASFVPVLEPWSWLISTVTTLLAPAFMMWLQKQTFEDIVAKAVRLKDQIKK